MQSSPQEKPKGAELGIGRRWAFAACVLGVCALAGPAFAQGGEGEKKPDPTVTANDSEIVVPGGRRLQDLVRTFVDDVSEPAKDGQLARFDRKICPGVVGAPAPVAQALIDRIAQRAAGLDLKIGEPGCRANVLIIVTPDAVRFTPGFVNGNRRLFGMNDQGATRGQTALNAFMNSQRAVRWWHVTQTVTDRGQVLGNSDAVGGDGSLSGAQVARVTNSGRLRAGTRQDFNRVIIIVDAGKVGKAPFPALSDYVAMVSLAQIDPNADVAEAPSILSLFSDLSADRRPQDGWTEWDQAYLEGLYGAPRFAKSGNLQESAITTGMTKGLSADKPEEAPQDKPKPQ
jgi:hypothetical protein